MPDARLEFRQCESLKFSRLSPKVNTYTPYRFVWLTLIRPICETS
jgi:hypothetical protein